VGKKGLSWGDSSIILCVVALLVVMGYITIHNLSVVPYLDNSMLSNNELTCNVLGIDTIIFNNESFGCAELMHKYNVETRFENRTLTINVELI